MATFISTTDDIPIPEVLGDKPSFGDLEAPLARISGAEYGEIVTWGEQIHLYLRKLEKHNETLARALNATAQMAWGKELSTAFASAPVSLTSTRPRSVASARLVFPTSAHVQAHYKAVVDIDTAPSATEELFAVMTVNGTEQSSSKSVLNLGSNWVAGQTVTLTGSHQFSIDKSTVVSVALNVGITNQSTGEVTVRDAVSGFEYRIEPRVAGV